MRSLPLAGAVAAVVALTLLSGSATATTPARAPKPRDVAAARALIGAITRFDQTALRHETEMTAAARAMLARVRAGCAGSIPASVSNGTSLQQAVAFDLVFEGAFDLSIAVIHPLDHAGLALATRLDHVHFSQRAFSRGIHGTAKVQRRLLALKPSDLCGDVKAAATGGFAADPPATTAFLKAFTDAGSSSAEGIPDILKKVKPFLLTTGDQASLTHLKTVDARYQTFSTNLGLKFGAKLGSVLAAAPPSGGGTGGFPTNPPPPGATGPARLTAAFATL